MRVSLASVAHWIRSLGQLDPEMAFGEGPESPHRDMPQADEIAAISENVQSRAPSRPGKPFQAFEMSAIRHAATLSLTPIRNDSTPCGLDADEPRWIY